MPNETNETNETNEPNETNTPARSAPVYADFQAADGAKVVILDDDPGKVRIFHLSGRVHQAVVLDIDSARATRDALDAFLRGHHQKEEEGAPLPLAEAAEQITPEIIEQVRGAYGNLSPSRARALQHAYSQVMVERFLGFPNPPTPEEEMLCMIMALGALGSFEHALERFGYRRQGDGLAEKNTPEEREPEWGWMFPDDEHASGPFDSRELALADAIAKIAEIEGENDAPSKPVEVILGHCVTPKPEDFAHDDIDWLLERMDDAVRDDVASYDDPVFVIPEGQEKAAEEALRAVLASWATRWVVVNVGWYLSRVEEVSIEADRA